MSDMFSGARKVSVHNRKPDQYVREANSNRPTGPKPSSNANLQPPAPVFGGGQPSLNAGWCSLEFSSEWAELVDEVLVLGRSPRYSSQDGKPFREIQIGDMMVSNTHLRVEPSNGQVLLSDLNSTNGTFILPPGTGQAVRLSANVATSVPNGTLVEIGSQRFVVRSPQLGGVAAPPNRPQGLFG